MNKENNRNFTVTFQDALDFEKYLSILFEVLANAECEEEGEEIA